MRQFQKLAEMSGRDGHLQQRLKQLLKLSKEKWDAACEHALTAVNVCFSTTMHLPACSLPHIYTRLCQLNTVSGAYAGSAPCQQSISIPLRIKSHKA